MSCRNASPAIISSSLPSEISHGLLRLAEETAKVGHWVINAADNSVYWSDEIYCTHGLSENSSPPDIKTLLDYYHPEDRPIMEACLENALSSGKDFSADLRLLLPTGAIRRVKVSARCFYEQGTLSHIYGTLLDTTEHHEERLRTEILSEQLNRFVESSYDGFWNRNFQNDYEYISPRFWEILGYDPNDEHRYTGEWKHMIFPEDLQIVNENFEKHVSTRGAHPFHQEVRYRHKDGSVVHMIYKGKVVAWDSNNLPLRMVGSHTDITAQHRAQQAAEDYAERFNLCVLGSNSGMWDWDIRTDSLFWSERFKNIIGIDDSAFVPHINTFNDRLHPDDKERVISALQAHLDNGDIPYNIEYRLRHTSGHYVHIHARGQSVRLPETGEAVRMAGSVDDISDFVKLRDQERAHYQLLSAMLEKSPDAIFVKDSAFRIMQANDAFLRFYPESERDSVIGTTTVEKYPKEERDKFLEHDRVALESGFSETIETIHFPNNEIRTLNTKKVRFEGLEGEPHILAIARDVTERETLIAELNRSNEELDDFAYIAAHDLKEPLRGMHNHARFLLHDHGDELAEKASQRIDRIIALATHAEHMISDLLYFSRISRTEDAGVAVDIRRLVVDTADSIFPEQDNAKLIITGDFPVTTCNRARIAEVFRNLITNGLKYNDSEEKIITIGVLPRQEDKDVYIPVYFVKDNGIGIKERHHKEIFRIFKQVHKHGKYEKSSGVGLTIVKKIIQNHQGDIWVESVPGESTTFFFTLGEIV